MGRTLCNATRQRGGVLLWTIVAVILVAGGYYAYRGLLFYRANIAPAVEEVSNVATVVKNALPQLKATRDPGEIDALLRTMLRIAPPEGYVGAFGLTFEILGKSSQMVALAPKGVAASDIFEGGRGEIRFNPGPHTIFLVAQSTQASREEVRDSIAKMADGEAGGEPFRPIFIDAGGRRVAAYQGTASAYGATNRAVYVFLDDGRMLYAVGPQSAFDEAALRRALAAIVAAHPANELLYSHPRVEAAAKPQSSPCGIAGLPAEFDIVMVSVSRGSTALDVALDKSGHDVTREDVVVGATPRPIVLILSGSDPVVWNVGQAPGARIAGILAQGPYRQAVMGIPKRMKVVSYSSSDGPNACPYFHEDSRKGPGATVSAKVRELFGKGIDTYLDRKASGAFIVGDINGEVTYSPDITLASVALPDNVLPGGQRGMDRLVKQGSLRIATPEEVAAWVDGAAKRAGMPLEDYRRRMRPFVGGANVYVALKDLELPDGMYGSNSRVFLVPAGLSSPGGPKGHNTFLVMEGFRCSGPGC